MNASSPLVSVLCLCYNHETYITETLQSVLNQTYTNIEILVIDDASTDNSRIVIENFIKINPAVQAIYSPHNQGNCTAFNILLKQAKGKYVIDLACDDVLMPQRIEKQVTAFEQASDKVAMVFSNTEIIDEQGKSLNYFYPINAEGKAIQKIPDGEVYAQIVEKSFISTPSMLFRKSALDELGGYDETLQYEDFDIWVRLARQYEFKYVDEVLTRKRKTAGSLGSNFYKINNSLVASSLKVCQKIATMNQTQFENLALAKRIRFFMRQAFYTHQFDLVEDFGKLLKQVHQVDFISKFVLLLATIHFPANYLYHSFDFLRRKIH